MVKSLVRSTTVVLLTLFFALLILPNLSYAASDITSLSINPTSVVGKKNDPELQRIYVNIKGSLDTNHKLYVMLFRNDDYNLHASYNIDLGSNFDITRIISFQLTQDIGTYTYQVESYIVDKSIPSWTAARTSYISKRVVNLPVTVKDIGCYSDADCNPQDHYAGSSYCQGADVYDTYVDWYCVNPGTANARCDSTVSQKLKQSCSGSCSNGQCYTGATLDAPSLLYPSDKNIISTTTPTLSWTSVNGADYYIISISENNVLKVSYISSLTSYQIPDGVLERGHTYQWNVLAKSSSGTGKPSQIFTFSISQSIGSNIIALGTTSYLRVVCIDDVLHYYDKSNILVDTKDCRTISIYHGCSPGGKECWEKYSPIPPPSPNPTPVYEEAKSTFSIEQMAATLAGALIAAYLVTKVPRAIVAPAACLTAVTGVGAIACGVMIAYNDTIDTAILPINITSNSTNSLGNITFRKNNTIAINIGNETTECKVTDRIQCNWNNWSYIQIYDLSDAILATYTDLNQNESITLTCKSKNDTLNCEPFNYTVKPAKEYVACGNFSVEKISDTNLINKTCGYLISAQSAIKNNFNDTVPNVKINFEISNSLPLDAAVVSDIINIRIEPSNYSEQTLKTIIAHELGHILGQNLEGVNDWLANLTFGQAPSNIEFKNNLISNRNLLSKERCSGLGFDPLNPTCSVTFSERGAIVDFLSWITLNGLINKNATLSEFINQLKNNSNYTVYVSNWKRIVSTDTNSDYKINLYDLVNVAKNFGQQQGNSNFTKIADLNSDGKIDIFDLAQVGKNYGKGENGK